jgi:transketolase
LKIQSKLPKIILANTVKGKGFSIMENKANWHYMNPMTPEQIEQCRKEIA